MRASIDSRAVRDLAREPGTGQAVAAAAAQVAAAARTLAPVRTGAYQRSIAVLRRSGYAYVTARDFKAGWIERGAGPSPVRGGRPFPARRVLERAVTGRGLRFKPSARK
jgi:hypothetical protein